MDVLVGFTDSSIREYLSRGYLFEYDDCKSIYDYVQNALYNIVSSQKPKLPIASVSLTAFYKPLIFMPSRGEYTWGEPHEILNISGLEHYISFPYYYMHVKSIIEIWEHALRNVFIGGGGLNVKSQNPVWTRLRQDATNRGLDTWQKLRQYLLGEALSGRVPQWLINYFIDMSYDCDKPWAAEVADSLRWFNAIYGTNINITCANAGMQYSVSTTTVHISMPYLTNFGVPVEADTVWFIAEKYGSVDFIKQYISSPTSAFAVVARLYDAILMRPVDRSGLNTYSKLLLRTNDVKQIVSILMNSDEYNARIGDKQWRDRVLSWDGKIDYGYTALPAKLMMWLKNKPPGSLLTIGCIDNNQRDELSMRHFVITYDLTDRGCGLPVNPWLYPLPNYQFDYVIVTPIIKLHPLPKYVATTAIALTKPGGYLVLPQPVPPLTFIVKINDVNDEYTIFQRVAIQIQRW
jgi:hypothetical protein